MHATDVAALCGAVGRGGASPLQRGQPIPGRAFGCDGWGAHARPVGVRRCLTRRPGGPADRRQRVRWCRDHRCRGGRQRTPGAEAPGSVRKPPEGGWRAHRRPGRSAGCRGRLDQPASAGLGTEPGRSRPGDRGYSRSADLRCVSCETCRPRGIAAPDGAAGEAAPRPYMVRRFGAAGTDGRHRPGARPHPVGVRRCLTRRPGRADPCRWGCVGRGAQKRGGGAACHAGCAAPAARRARQRLAPTQMGRHVAGATDTCHGGAVSPVL